MAEDDFWMQFSLKHPELLGAIFDALAGALRERHTVELAERPRLADWGLFAAALYKSQGWGVDAFVDDWKGVEETQQQGTLDGSIVAQAVILYMKDKDRVELSARKLHDAIQKRADDDLDLTSDKTWPKTGRTLWKKIREVTPLLEAHGIRAYRSSSNKTGRPIILDTDFTDNDPESSKDAIYGDDKGDDNRPGDDKGDDKLSPSSPDNADAYTNGDDNGAGGRYFGVSLALHTLTNPGEEKAGESMPDLSSPSSPTAVSALFSDPPDWLRRQVGLYHANPSERMLRPLCSSAAAELYNDPRRGEEIRAQVEDELGRWGR